MERLYTPRLVRVTAIPAPGASRSKDFSIVGVVPDTDTVPPTSATLAVLLAKDLSLTDPPLSFGFG